MRISPQPVKRAGKITSWRFVYYDKELKKPTYLKKSDHPKLKDIKTEKQARDFANNWNANLDKKKAQVKAKRRRDLYSNDFDFLGSLDAYKEYQKQFEKCYIHTYERVEKILNKLILNQQRTHPNQFRELDYRKVLQELLEERNLSISSLKKYRSSFNKYLRYMYEFGKIEYEHILEIPISTVRLIEKNQKNTHSQSAVTLGKIISIDEEAKKKRKARVEKLTLKQLLHLLKYSQNNPDKIPEHLARLYFIAGTVGLRRGALLALQHRNIEVRDGNRMYIVPDLTIQRFEGEEGNKYMVDKPDHIKDTPEDIPIWLEKTAECIKWWLEYSKQFYKKRESYNNAWIFPASRVWRPEGVNDKNIYEPGSLPMYPDSVSRPFKKHLKFAGLPQIPFKNLRHSSANLVAQLTDIETAKELLGHKSDKTTKGYYLDPKVVKNTIQQFNFDSEDEKLWKIRDQLKLEPVA